MAVQSIYDRAVGAKNKRDRLFAIFVVLWILFPLLVPLLGSRHPSTIIAIRARKIITGTGQDIENGIVVIADGKIMSVGREVLIPGSADVIDARTDVVMPGMIDAHLSLGQDEEHTPVVECFTPEQRAIDNFRPVRADVTEALEQGITTAMAVPENSNAIGGQCGVIKVAGGQTSDRILSSGAGIRFLLGATSLSLAGIESRSQTRMLVATSIREELAHAKEYLREKQAYAKRRPGATRPSYNVRMELLGRLLKGKMIAWFDCSDKEDVEVALDIISEFKLRAGFLHAEQLELPASVTSQGLALVSCPASEKRPGFLAWEAMVKRHPELKMALSTNSIGAAGARSSASPLELVRLAAVSGLGREKALQSLTLTAAEVLGVSQRIGSIEPGKDADLLILSGDPLNPSTRIRKVLINGRIVYDTHQ